MQQDKSIFLRFMLDTNHTMSRRLGQALSLTGDSGLIFNDQSAREVLQVALAGTNVIELCLSAVDEDGNFKLPSGFGSEVEFYIELARRYEAAAGKITETAEVKP